MKANNESTEAKRQPEPRVVRTDAIVEKILAGLRQGTPLTVICRQEGMPAPRTVREWAQFDAENLGAAIAHAREEGEDAIAWECMEIADDGRNDYMEKTGKDGQAGDVAFDAEHVQRSKLRIETRLKLLAKFNPKRWGEKQQIEHSGNIGLAERLASARQKRSGLSDGE